MAAINYKIKIVRGSDQFEAEGDRKFVLQMLERFESGGESVQSTPQQKEKSQKIEQNKSLPPPAKGKSISVGEFIRQQGSKTHMDIVLAFGYYLETYAGLKEFSAADINNCYYEAKLETSNTSQMIVQNIRKGLMMAAKGSGKKKKNFTLTQSGEAYILAGGKKSSK